MAVPIHNREQYDDAVEFVHQDDFLLVVNKPAGMLAVPGRGADKQDCLSASVRRLFPDTLIVHRLDMATSGLMVFARGLGMQRRLSRLFQDRKVDKRYVALVTGKMGQEAGEIAWPLIADWPNRPRQKVDHMNGKPALTRFRVLSYDKLTDITRLELQPVTGRTHQLRVHLMSFGHAIMGDLLYQGPAASRLMLHASALDFAHPVSGVPMELRSNTPF